jgi:hypothetical protein
MNEKQRQLDKEEAVLVALQHDMALIRRGLEIHGLKKNGLTQLISKSISYDELWHDALVNLKRKFSVQ